MNLSSQLECLWEHYDKIENYVKLAGFINVSSENKVRDFLLESGELECDSLIKKAGLDGYSMHLIDNESEFNFYRSTLFGFALTKINEMTGLAVLGFSFRKDASIIIEQIQGSKSSYSAKNLPRDWDYALVNFSLMYFRDKGFEDVYMIKSNQEPYFYRPVGVDYRKLDAHKNRMYSRYDCVALKAGFKLNEENKFYIKI